MEEEYKFAVVECEKLLLMMASFEYLKEEVVVGDSVGVEYSGVEVGLE